MIFSTLLAMQCGGGGGGGTPAPAPAAATCKDGQTKQADGTCVTPVTCVSPKILQDNQCIDIPAGTFAIVWQTGYSSSQTFLRNQSITALATPVNGTIATCTASILPEGITFAKTASGCLLSGNFTMPKAQTTYTFSATSTDGKSASASLNITVNCLTGSGNVDASGACPNLVIIYLNSVTSYSWGTNSGVNIAAPSVIIAGIYPSTAVFSVNPAFPAWLTLNTATGAITGQTPFATYSLAVHTITALSLDNAKAFVNFSIRVVPDIDIDKNGLIDITTLDQLYNIRYSLNGSSYKESDSATAVTSGCPSNLCRGYELKNSLDFAGSKWSTGAGWEPIGQAFFPFAATFEGNGFTIQNLYINNSTNSYVGFFGSVENNEAYISNLSLTNVWVSVNNSLPDTRVGVLTGNFESGATIINSNVTGVVTTMGGGKNVGGLVGKLNTGIIRNSYAKVSVTASGGGDIRTGGLLGDCVGNYGQAGATDNISNSYATGSVYASGGNANGIGAGGLIGNGNRCIVKNSYATGSTHAIGGATIIAGGFIANSQARGSYSNNYATGWVSVTASGIPSDGGFMGKGPSGDVFSNNYWDKDTTGQSTSVGSGDATVKGLTNSQMTATTGTFPNNLNNPGSCFQLTSGSYPKLFRWEGSACTSTLLGGQ